MRSLTHWVSDYRLAAYVVVAAVVGGVVAFALDRATAPAVKIEANVAPASGVRQIPITRTTAADFGDPDGKLTPIYPAAPGKDLPIKDTPVVQPVKPPAETTGSANASAQTTPAEVPPAAALPVQPATPVASAAPQPANACNVAACAAAYRSFRESDCTYQPFEGPRRYCEGAPAASGQAASQSQPQSKTSAKSDTRSTTPVARSRYDDELREVERAVRRLPPPGGFDDEDTVVVIEAPQQRYDLRRNWISEPQD